MINMKVEFYPDTVKERDWYDRILWLWYEDDARPPGRERLDSAFARIAGRPDSNRWERDELDRFEEGDAHYTLYRGGWVRGFTCEGGCVGVVVQPR